MSLELIDYAVRRYAMTFTKNREKIDILNEKKRFLESRFKKLDEKEREIFLNLEKFYEYRLFEIKNSEMVKEYLSDSKNPFKEFYKNVLNFSKSFFIPVKNTGTADDFLQGFLFPEIFREIFKTDFRISIKQNTVKESPSSVHALYLFKIYYFYKTIKDAQRNTLKELFLSLYNFYDSKLNDNPQNPDAFLKYSIYGSVLFVFSYFDYLLGKKKSLNEMKKYLSDSFVRTMSYVGKNGDYGIHTGVIYYEAFSPMGLFVENTEGERNLNVFNVFLDYAEHVVFNNKNNFENLFYFKNESEKSRFKESLKLSKEGILLDKDIFEKEFVEFLSRAIKKSTLFFDLKEILNEPDSDKYGMKESELFKRFLKGIEATEETMKRISKIKTLNFKSFNEELKKKGFLSPETEKKADSLIYNFLVENLEIVSDKKSFFDFLQRYADYKESKKNKQITYEREASDFMQYEGIPKEKKEEIMKIFKNKEDIRKTKKKYGRKMSYLKILEESGINDVAFDEPHVTKAIDYIILSESDNFILTDIYMRNNIHYQQGGFLRRYETHSDYWYTFFENVLNEQLEDEALKYGNTEKFYLTEFLHFTTNELHYALKKNRFNEHFFEQGGLGKKEDKNFYPFKGTPKEILGIALYEKVKESGIDPLDYFSVIKDDTIKAFFGYRLFCDAVTSTTDKNKIEEIIKKVTESVPFLETGLMKKPGTFFYLKESLLTYIGKSYSVSIHHSEDRIKNFVKNRRDSVIKRASLFARNLKWIIKNKEAEKLLFFTANTAFLFLSPPLNPFNSTKKHYNILSKINDFLSSYKFYNSSPPVPYKDSLFGNSKILFFGRNFQRSYEEHTIRNTIFTKTDVLEKMGEEGFKILKYLFENQSVPFTMYEAENFLFQGKAVDNISSVQKIFIFMLYAFPFSYKIVPAGTESILRNKDEIIGINVSGNPKDKARLDIAFKFEDYYYEIIPLYKGYSLNTDFSMFFNYYINNFLIKTATYEIMDIKNKTRIYELLSDKVRKNDFIIKNTKELFKIFVKPDKFKEVEKLLLSTLKESYKNVKDQKISPNVLKKVLIKQENVYPRMKEEKNKKSEALYPLICGPLFIDSDRAEEESAAVFLVNYKNYLENVKELTRRRKEQKIERTLT